MALEWLKENNPLYKNIYICPTCLNKLPIHGVPEEISSVTKFSDNTSLLAKERAGYVPDKLEDVDNGVY